VAVRNDHMLISPATASAPAAAGAAANTAGMAGLGATVTDVEYQGTYVLLGLDAPTTTGAHGRVGHAARIQPLPSTPTPPGESVHLSWNRSACRTPRTA
jgi:putative spermidine/putrescine transport system ATP-binding protein